MNLAHSVELKYQVCHAAGALGDKDRRWLYQLTHQASIARRRKAKNCCQLPCGKARSLATLLGESPHVAKL